MEEILHLNIEKPEQPPTSFPVFPQLPEPAFSQLHAEAQRLGIDATPPHQDSLISIRAPAGDPAVKIIFERLHEFGWDVAHRFIPRSMRTKKFHYYITRSYSECDLDAADLLYLMNWQSLTDFVGRDGDRWIGDVEYVGADTELGWAQQIGTIGQHTFFVSPLVQQQMTEFNVRGLHFYRLRWNKPAKANGEYWELDSELRMPPCLLPVVNMDGPLAYEEDRPYSPVELQFRRVEVEAMGQFDAAWTREEVGDLRRNDLGRHWLVVSQKFRRLFRSLNLPSTYGVVRLID